jgi:hypothetical protein
MRRCSLLFPLTGTENTPELREQIKSILKDEPD